MTPTPEQVRALARQLVAARFPKANQIQHDAIFDFEEDEWLEFSRFIFARDQAGQRDAQEALQAAEEQLAKHAHLTTVCEGDRVGCVDPENDEARALIKVQKAIAAMSTTETKPSSAIEKLEQSGLITTTKKVIYESMKAERRIAKCENCGCEAAHKRNEYPKDWIQTGKSKYGTEFQWQGIGWWCEKPECFEASRIPPTTEGEK